MDPGALTQDIHESQIEIQNEVDDAEAENPNKKNTTTVQICEIDKQNNQNEYVHETRAEVIINNNMDTHVKKEKMLYGVFGTKKEGTRLPEYWVQFNAVSPHRMPVRRGSVMEYEPSRNSFVRLVFVIVLFMLILTAGFVTFVLMTDAKKIFMRLGMMPLIIGMVCMLALNYAMMCSECTRVPPWNFLCLFLAVCIMSFIAAVITVRYRTDIILLALMATIATVFVCLCLACTSFDFTRFLLYIIAISTAFFVLVLIIFVTMYVTDTRYKPLTLAILVIATLLNVVILIMELQMILGGRAVELSENDYALGAYMLYTSIVDIFIKLVQIMGLLDN